MILVCRFAQILEFADIEQPWPENVLGKTFTTLQTMGLYGK